MSDCLEILLAEAPVLIEPPQLIDARPHECRSGAAEGADSLWGEMAARHDHQVTHYTFAGYKVRATRGEIVELSETQLAMADQHCQTANVLLQRHYPPNNAYVHNLLRRNWYQVVGSASLYAVSSIDKNQQVAGGTAWAVAMFLIKHDLRPCAAYVFDQEVRHWFAWQGAWVAIYQPPRPQGIYAGIGTRKLNLNGRLAIKTAFED